MGHHGRQPQEDRTDASQEVIPTSNPSLKNLIRFCFNLILGVSHQKLSIHEYENILRGYQKQLSLNTPLKNGEDITYLELLEKQDAIPCDEQIIKQELNSKISELLMDLPEREKEILRMRFGFDGEEKTLGEIGRKIGVSRERVRQIEKRAKEELKRKSNSKTSFEPLS